MLILMRLDKFWIVHSKNLIAKYAPNLNISSAVLSLFFAMKFRIDLRHEIAILFVLNYLITNAFVRYKILWNIRYNTRSDLLIYFQVIEKKRWEITSIIQRFVSCQVHNYRRMCFILKYIFPFHFLSLLQNNNLRLCNYRVLQK